MGRIAFFLAAALIVSGAGMHQASAQTDSTAKQKAEKQKTEKKETKKPAAAQSDSGQSAPMSGFRPDPQSNY
jgi:hypothetical protein